MGELALVLKTKSDDQLKPYLKELFKWLQDLNWPGANIILERLKKFNHIKIKDEYEKIIIYANSNNDINWLYWLSYLLDNDELKYAIDYDCLTILENNKLTLDKME